MPIKTYHDTLLTHHQVRIGKNRKAFVIHKFRTMPRNSHTKYDKILPRDHIAKTTVLDPRTTKIGRVIRKLKIDELPQIINLLKGDLTLIGIRPLTRQSFTSLPLDLKEAYAQVGPGLAGIQYSLKKSERTIPNVMTAYRKFFLDLKHNKTKAYAKWGLKILKNIYR